MAAVFRPWTKKNGKFVRATNYVVQFKHPVTGKRVRQYLGTSNKKVAEHAAAKLLEKLELQAIGVLPPESITAKSQSLAELLADYIAVMESRGLTRHYVRNTKFRIARVLELTKWTHPSHIAASGMEKALAAIRAAGVAPKTANYYLSHVRTWAEWMRIPNDPLRDVRPLKTQGEKKRKRRALSDDEADRLLAAAIGSSKKVEGYTGEERYWAYQLAMATGLRANEIRSVATDSFDWTANTVRVVSGSAKNRREAIQPLPLSLASAMRAFVDRCKPGRIWKRMKDAYVFLQHDLDAAGVPYVLKGEHADFHAMRYTFATRLAAAGVPPCDRSTAAAALRRESDHWTVHARQPGRASRRGELAAPILAPAHTPTHT